jgi:outer membrane lipoprotein-sorting protein
MKKCCGISLAALTALLLGLAGSRAGDDKAKELFEKMEKTLAEAKTLQVESEAKIKGGVVKESTIKATHLLAEGNKMRAEVTFKLEDKDFTLKSISDGTKMKNETPMGLGKEKDTPKDLQEEAVAILARIGPAGALRPLPEGTKLKVLKLSDFKLGKSEKINGREAQAVEYQLTFPKAKEATKATVWIDVKTHVPLRRTLRDKATITEDYQVQINPKIADEKFQLPK